MCVPWNEDSPADLPIIETRLKVLLSQIAADAAKREVPTVAMACGWHHSIHAGLDLPEPYYAGVVRDADPNFPCLVGYEVQVGTVRGVPAANVPAQLDIFERSMQEATASLDAAIPAGWVPQERDELGAVIQLCALAHGEWVRIHPFANGNGRTARLWANWCALRYGVPPFVRLRPRPGHPSYAQAAAASMHGDHDLMVIAFLDMLLATAQP